MSIRDVEGGEAGTEWSEAEWSTGAKRTPEQARPRAKRGGMPKEKTQSLIFLFYPLYFFFLDQNLFLRK